MSVGHVLGLIAMTVKELYILFVQEELMKYLDVQVIVALREFNAAAVGRCGAEAVPEGNIVVLANEGSEGVLSAAMATVID